MRFDYIVRVFYNKKFYMGISPDWTELKFLTGELVNIDYHKPYIDFIFEYIVNDLKYSINLNLMVNQTWTRNLLCLAPNIKDKEVMLFLTKERKVVFRAIHEKKILHPVKYESIAKNLILFYE